MKKRILLILAVIVVSGVRFKANAQNEFRIGQYSIDIKSPLKIEKVKYEKTKNKFNHRQNITDSYVNLGVPIKGEGDKSLDMYEGRSSDFTIGWRKYYYTGKTFAIGPEFHWDNNTYRLNEGAGASLGFDTSELGQIRKEFLKTHSIGMEFNIRKDIGYYKNSFILGPYFDWVYSGTYKVKYYSGSGNKGKKKYKDESMFSDYHYGVRAELCFGKFGFYGKYRINRCFEKSSIPLDAPQMTLGVTIISR